jgi:hypothetical protein
MRHSEGYLSSAKNEQEPFNQLVAGSNPARSTFSLRGKSDITSLFLFLQTDGPFEWRGECCHLDGIALNLIPAFQYGDDGDVVHRAR